MSLTPLLALVLACAHAPRDLTPAEGRVGIRYRALPEGLLVTAVMPGSGAAAAGLGTGDLIVGVDGVPVATVSAAGLSRMLPGSAGSALALTVQGPLGADERALNLTRGARLEDDPDPTEAPEIVALRRALSRGQTSRAVQAAERLVAADFAGQRPGYAAARALRLGGRSRPEAYAAAARTLADARPQDIDLQFLAAEALYRAGAYKEAAERWQLVETLRPPDVSGDGGWRGDIGGNPWGRTMLARALFSLGRREDASEVARSLARTRDVGDLLHELSLPAPPPGTGWRAPLDPVPNFEASLLDGGTFVLADARGRPVLLNFWASWCAPCMQELPHLQALWEEQREAGLVVLAISVDDPGDRAAVERTAKKLGLTLPIAHAPELAARFAVGPIPSARLLGRDGSLRFVDHGYSPSGMARMAEQVRRALAEPAGERPMLGTAWTRGEARLGGYLGLQGVDDVALDADGVLLGVADHLPVRLEASAGGLVAGLPTAADPLATASQRVAWLEGPVAAAAGEPWLRAWTPEGEGRWLRTTPDPVQDLAQHDGLIWAATAAEVLAFDAAGGLVTRIAGGAEDLAVAEGGLWAVDGARRRWLARSGAEDRGEATDGACALSDGRWASRFAESCVVGRFGADGGLRAVMSREDGVVVGLDANGDPAFTLTLQARSRLAALDLDGDGRDALLVAIHGQGLAWIELVLP